MINFFRGIATAMITPFIGENVNFEEFKKMIEYQIAEGTDALVVLGTTGEPSTMTEDEKEKVISFAVKTVNKRVKVIVGSGSNNTLKAVEFSKKAEILGADGLLVVTPYYNKCTQKGLIEYYNEICGSVKIPVIAYSVPSRTGVNILPETVAELVKIPNFAGIKEASGNMAQVTEIMRVLRGKADLFSGEDALNLPMYAIGGAGAISVVSNIAPKEVKNVYALAKQNKYEDASKAHDLLLPLTSACFCEVNPIPVKEGCNIIGFNAGIPRKPLTKLENGNREKLKNAIKGVGVKVYD